MALTQQQLDTLRNKLTEQQEKLTSVMVSFTKTDPANDVDRVNDNADLQTEAIEDEELVRHESLERETQILLDRVHDALARIEQGTYGVTEEGEEIPYERLLIDPTATTLVSS